MTDTRFLSRPPIADFRFEVEPAMSPLSSSRLSSLQTPSAQLGPSAESKSALDALANSSSKEPGTEEAEPLKEAFGDFVGQTLFGSMLSTMRESVGKPAYFHGGRTEEVFQQQMDQHLVEAMSDASADTIANPMFELFQMQRRA
ncbi:rod-binding protein [Rhodopirellula sp. P2]|uniref:rod-binding protein n=1 Tax=Rhodopirellula sp. P2 TaxID=2127060 RepID=UPI002367DB10|nr:rod-binding protein [Rhodopirellula sp. P2]WDQ16814.1 rod-binding protein [Rhodopirellula sp. P2]